MVVQPPRNSSHEFSHQIPKLTRFFLRNSPYWEAGNDHEALSISKHKWEKRCHHRRLSLTLASGFSHYIEESIAKNIPNFPTERKPVFTWSVQHPPNNTSKVIYKSWKPNLKKKNVKFGVKFLFLNPSYYLSNFHVWSLAEKEKKRLTGRLSLAPMIICFTSAYSCDEPQKWFVVVGIQCSLKRP